MTDDPEVVAAGRRRSSLAILAAGWFLLVSPKRSEAAALRDQATARRPTTPGCEQKIAELKAQQADLPAAAGQLAASGARSRTTRRCRH